VEFKLDVTLGPTIDLIELYGEVDLLQLGSGRRGTVARVLHGSTGDALMRNASCPVRSFPASEWRTTAALPRPPGLVLEARGAPATIADAVA